MNYAARLNFACLVMRSGRSFLDIAWRLSVTLAALDIKQNALAAQCEFSTSQVNNWLAATARPSIDAANRMCDDLGITLDWIYRGDASRLDPGLRAKIAEAGRAIPIVGTRAERHGKRSA